MLQGLVRNFGAERVDSVGYETLGYPPLLVTHTGEMKKVTAALLQGT